MPSVHGVNDDGAGFGVKGENTTPPDLGHPHEAGVVGTSQSGVGVFGTSGDISRLGVFGSAGIGVQGVCPDGTGVSGHSGTGHGVTGDSQTNNGVSGSSGSGRGVFGFSNGGEGVHGESQSNQHAGVSGINDNGIAIFARGKKQAAQFVQTDSGSDQDGVQSTAATSGHAAVSAINTGGGFGLWAKAKTAGHFEGDVEVTGDIRLLGGDCAEDFDIGAVGEVEPGTVMVLDGNGALRPSEQEYDKKVAGVISGAGDYRPGITLGKCESTQRRMPLALVGKVYCKVDAQYGAVEVGDLLTTSPTPGHAMRAADPLKAFGAVIGKALQPLRSSAGLIRILIGLQ